MAKQLNINLAMTADTGKARAELSALQKQLTDLMTSAQKSPQMSLSKDIQKATVLASQLKVQLESATSSTGNLNLTKFNNELRASKTTINDYKNALMALGPSGTQAFSNLATSILKAEVPLRRSNTLLTNFATTLKNTARWQISSSILHGFMGTIQSAYGYAQDLNESLNNIRIVTGQSVDQMAQFAEQANKAAKALSTTTTAYTDAALIYYQQGLRGRDVTDRTDVTIKLANVTRQSAEEVSSQMTAIWNNFDDGTKSLEYYADAITALGASTASSSAEIANGLQKFAAVADTVGLSYEKATAALATVVAETRQSADVVGTAFKTMFARVQGLTLGETLEDGVTLNKYSKALKTVGVDILDANQELKNMDTILDELGNKWNTISEAQKVALAETVAGTRQYAQFMAIMNNYDKILSNQSIATNAEGTLQGQADIYAESWEAASKRVKAAAQDIYNDLLDDKFFIKLLNGFEKVLNVVDNFIEGIGGVGPLLTLIGSIVTQVFGNQISAAIRNTINDLHTLTAKGQAEVQAIRQQAQQGLMEVATSQMNTGEGQGTAAALTAQSQLQDTVNQKAAQLSEEQLKQVQTLLDINRLIGEEAIEAGKVYDAQVRTTQEIEKQLKSNAFKNGGRSVYSDVSTQINNLKNSYTNLNQATDTFYEKLNKQKINEGNISKYSTDILQLVNNLKNSGVHIEHLDELLKALETDFAQNDFAAAATDFDTLSTIIEGGLVPDLDDLTIALLDVFPNEEQARAAAERLAHSLQEERDKALDAAEANKQVGDSAAALSAKIAQMVAPVDLVATGITRLSSILMSLSTAINAIKNIGNIISDDSLSAGEKAIQIFSALAMILPLITALVNKSTVSWTTNLVAVIANNTAHSTGVIAKIAHKAATLALKTATDELTISMLASLGVIGLIIIAIGALIFAIIKLVGWLKKISVSNYDKTMKTIAEETEGLKEELDETQQAAKDLKSEFDSYGDIVHKLEECTKGTTEWKDALQDALDKTDEILQKYPQLLAMEGALNPDGTLNLSVLEGLLGQETAKTQALSYAQFGEAGRAAGANKYHSKETTVSTYASSNTAYSKLASDYYGGLSGVAGTQLLSWGEIQDFLSAGKQITTEDLINQILSDEERASNDLFLDDPAIKASIEDLVSQINATTQGYVHMNDVVEQGQTRIDQAIQDTANNLAIKYAANNGITADSAQLFYGGQYGQEAFNKVYNGFGEDYGHSTNSKNAEVVDLKKQYLSNVRGFSEDLIDQTSVAVKKEGNKFVYTFTDSVGNIIDTIDAETIKLAIAGQAAGEAVQEGFDFVTRQLEGVNAGENARNLTNGLFDSAMRNGGQANFSDVLGSLSADQLSKMTDTDSILEILNISETELSAIATLVGMTGNEFVAAITGARTALLDEFASLPQDIQNIFHSLPVDQLINLKELFKNNSEIKADFSEIINQIPEELQAEVAEAFSKVNFSDFDSIEQFKEYLQSLGIDFGVDLDQFAKKIEIAGQAIRNVNVDELAEKFGKVQKIIDKVSTGGEISAKDYAELSPSQQGYFRQKADDSYAMVGSAEELRNDAINERKTELGREVAYSDTNVQSIQTQLATAIDTQEIEALTSSLEQEQTKLEGLSFQYLSLAENMQELGQRHSELIGLTNNSQEAQQAYGEALITLAAQYDNTKQEIEAYQAALRSNDEEAIKVAEHNLAVATSVAEDAAAFSLEADELEVLADIFSQDTDLLGNLNAEEKDAARITADMAEAAADAATRYKRLNNGINDLADNYSDYEAVLKRVKKAQTAEDKATVAGEKNYKALRKTLADILDVNEELLDTNFMSNLDPDVLNDLAEGGEKAEAAMVKIRDAFIDAQAAEYGLSEVSDQLKEELNQLAEGDVINLDNSPALMAMIEAWVQAGLTADEIQSRLSGMQIDCDVTPFTGSLQEAVDASAAAGDAIIANASIDAEAKTLTVDSTDVNQDTAFNESVSVRDVPGMFFSAETESGDLKKQVTHFPEYHKVVTPVTVSEEVTKQSTATGIKLSNAHKSGGGKVSNTSGRSGGGGGSKGGGGGGSSKTGTAKSHKNPSDSGDRYHYLNERLDDLSKAYERASKAKDRLYGKDKLKAMKEEIAALEKIIKHNQTYLKVIDTYLKKDKDKLINGGLEKEWTDKDGKLQKFVSEGVKGAIFDENGNIVNYDDIIARAQEAYNQAVEAYNQVANAEGVTEEQLKIAEDIFKQAEMQYDLTLEAIKTYEESLNLRQDKLDEIRDAFREEQDKRFEEWKYKLDLRIKIDEESKKELEYYRKHLERFAKDAFAPVTELLSYWNNTGANSTWSILQKSSENLLETAKGLLGTSHGEPVLDANGNLLSGYDFSQEDWISGLDDVQGEIQQTIDELYELDDTMCHYYEETLSAAEDRLDKYMQKMEDCTAVLKHFQTVSELLGKETDYEWMGEILQAQHDTIQNELESATKQFKLAQAQYNTMKQRYEEAVSKGLVDEGTRQVMEDELQAQYESMSKWQEKMLSKTEEYAEASIAVYENMVKKQGKIMEDAMTGGQGFDSMLASMDRVSAYQDLILTKTNQVYETNKLMRKLSQDIDKTDSVAAKTKLSNFKKEIEDMQNMNEMSKFDLDVANARYEILKAQIALEEAQNAKSTVRLQRDSEGNYGYVYTADQDKIDDAAQALEDKQNDLYNLTLNKANENARALAELDKEMYDELERIAIEYRGDEEKIWEESLRVREEYAQRRKILERDYTEADYWQHQVSITKTNEAYGDFYRQHLVDTEDWEQLVTQYILDIKSAHDDWTEDMSTYVEPVVGESLDELKDKTEELKDKSEEYQEWFDDFAETNAKRLAAIAEITNAYFLQRQEIEALISRLEEMNSMINQARAEAAGMGGLDDDYDPTKDYSDLMAHYLAGTHEYEGRGPGSQGDAEYQKLRGYRERKIDELGLDPSYYGSRGSEFDEVVQTYVDQGLTGYIQAAVDAWKESGITEAQEANTEAVQTNTETVNPNTEAINANSEALQTNSGTLETITETQKANLDEAVSTFKSNVDEGISTISSNLDEDIGNVDNVLDESVGEVSNSLSEAESSIDNASNHLVNALERNGSTISNAASRMSSSVMSAAGMISSAASMIASAAARAGSSGAGSFDTGGYTGAWGSAGKLAILHEKELVLNEEDTANILATIDIVRQITSAIDLRAGAAGIAATLSSPGYSTVPQQLDQTVTITAEFPNVQDHNEIEVALNSLVNRATQYAARQ